MKANEKRGRWIALGVVLGLVVAWGGFSVAQAVIPAPGGVIKACYKKNGNLRVLDSAAACKPKETPIQWSQTGPAGPPGSAATAMFRAGKTVSQEFADGPIFAAGPYPSSFVKVAFDNEQFDAASAYNPATSTFVAPSAGYYEFGAGLLYDSAATIELILAINGDIYTRMDRTYATGGISGTSLVPLQTGDSVQVWIYASSGSALIHRDGVQETPGYPYRNASFFGHRLAS